MLVKVGHNELRVIDMGYLAVTIEREMAQMSTLRKMYEQKLAKLPKGSIHMKYRGGKPYHYLTYRNGARVMPDYVGTNEKQLKVLREQLEHREHIETILKGLTREICLMNKTLDELS